MMLSTRDLKLMNTVSEDKSWLTYCLPGPRHTHPLSTGICDRSVHWIGAQLVEVGA